MKLITHKNYFQQKQWQMASIKKSIHDEASKMTPEELEANQQHRAEKFEQLRAKIKESVESSHYEPLCLKRWLFQRASTIALQLAKDYSLDVYIESSEQSGRIRFITDQLISESEWKNNRGKRRLLRLMQWADSVWIDTIEDSGLRLVQISLTYEVSKLVLNK